MQSYPRADRALHKQNQVNQLNAGIKNKTGLKTFVLEFIEACLNIALLKTRDLSQNVTLSQINFYFRWLFMNGKK